MTGGDLGWRAMERDGARVAAPSGRVDEPNANAFTEMLVAEVGATGAGKLVLDLSEVVYMSSRGLRALTLAQRKASESGTSIVLAAANPTMREILAISRYDLIFSVVDTVDQAIAT